MSNENCLFENNFKCDVNGIINSGRDYIEMNLLISNEYKYNVCFKKFIDDFCKRNGCTLEDAFNDERVKRRFWMYTEV